MKDEQQILAVFIDYENLALGFKDRNERFDITRVLNRLLEKGNIVAKRAYADWNRFAAATTSLHESAIELIEIPLRRMTGKNSADMRLCVDAMDLSYSKPHITTFVILSGDSDFSPLVSKLRENNKQVIGLGMRDSTSALLRDNCDEYIFYEDLAKETAAPSVQVQGVTDKQKEAFAILLETLEALRRENREKLWSALIKMTIKRKSPSFNESSYGYRNFSGLLEDAQRHNLVQLSRDASDRTYIVTSFGNESAEAKPQRRAPRKPRQEGAS
ncbi:MAG: NYN domain-containing protein [Lentisphaerota bacterium]